jgi:hypothetical protein
VSSFTFMNFSSVRLAAVFHGAQPDTSHHSRTAAALHRPSEAGLSPRDGHISNVHAK